MLSYRVAATIAMNGLERNCSIDRSMEWFWKAKADIIRSFIRLGGREDL